MAATLAHQTPIVKSSIATVRSTSSLFRVKLEAETRSSLKCVYLINLPFIKIGELRTLFRQKGFTGDKILNLSFLGPRLCEFLVTKDYFDTFKSKAKRFGYIVHERFDPMDFSDHTFDSILGSYNAGLGRKQKIHQFAERVAKDVKSCKNMQVTRFYRTWAEKLECLDLFEGWIKTMDRGKVTNPSANVAKLSE